MAWAEGSDAEKEGPGKPEPVSSSHWRQFRVRYSGFAVPFGRLADQALKRLEGLFCKLAVQFADLPRLGYRVLVGPFHEFGLNFHRLVERADAGELLAKRPELLERFPGVVAIGIGDRLQADRRRFGGRGLSARRVGGGR